MGVHGKDNTHLERRPFEILTSRLAHLSIHSFLHSLLDSTSVKSLTFWNWNFVYSRQWPRGAFLLGSEEKSRQHISTNWGRRNVAYLHNDQPIYTCVHPNGPSRGRCPIRIQNDLESTRSHRRRSHLHVDWDNLRRPSIRDSRIRPEHHHHQLPQPQQQNQSVMAPLQSVHTATSSSRRGSRFEPWNLSGGEQ